MQYLATPTYCPKTEIVHIFKMSRSMQNLLREFRSLYEERLQKLDMSPLTPQNLRAKTEVYQHYIHDLLEQNDALVNALKDSEFKLETSGEIETSLMEEVNLAKVYEAELETSRETNAKLQDELANTENELVRLREQLEDSDEARKRLCTTISESHNDLVKARLEMSDLRDKIRKFETGSESIDQTVLRLKVELEEEQGEVQELTNKNSELSGSVECFKSTLNSVQAKNRKLVAELTERDATISNLEKDLSEFRIGQQSIENRENHEKQQKIVLAAKISELEKEIKPLRAENDTTSDKLTREKELSMELAATVSRLKDQVQIQMENYKKVEASQKEQKRKNKELQDEIFALDKRRSKVTAESQKLRELLNVAQTDRQNLKHSSKQAENEHLEAVTALQDEKNKISRDLESKTVEAEELTTKIEKLNRNIENLKAIDKSAKEENIQLEKSIVDQKREVVKLSSTADGHKDRISELSAMLHERDVDIDSLRSSYTNKAAETEELIHQLSKQEQLVHELTTELNTKSSELCRLTVTYEEVRKELNESVDLARCQKLKIDSIEEVLASLKSEIADYEKMKPHPEVEVLNLRTQIDSLALERDSLNVKKLESDRRANELYDLCNELRNKLKNSISQRDKTQQALSMFETKAHGAQIRTKELEVLLDKSKQENQKETEKMNSKLQVLQKRVEDTEVARMSADQLCHKAQLHSQQLQVEIDKLKYELNAKHDLIVKLERDVHLGNNELDILSQRVKENHVDNVKMENLVDELTSNCENLQRHKRESEELLKVLRREISMTSKARKSSDKQLENYRVISRQADETAITLNLQIKRLSEQLEQTKSNETNMKTKKRELKNDVNELNLEANQLKNLNAELKRDNQDLVKRTQSLEEALKTLRREFDVVHQKTKREYDHIKKAHEITESELHRKSNELEAKNLRLQGECARLGDTIEKTESALNASKLQLSQGHRAEQQANHELQSIRSQFVVRDKREKELQIEIERLQYEMSKANADLYRKMRETEALVAEDEKLRKYSMKQQTLIQELRRKLAMFNSDLKADFKVPYQPHVGAYGDFAATQ